MRSELKSASVPLNTLKSVFPLMPSTPARSVNCQKRHDLSVSGRDT